MTVPVVPIYDCIGANVAHLPSGQVAGYTTGVADVPWTPAQRSAHPGMVDIDQTPVKGAWDALADVQDVEAGAVTVPEVPARVKLALAAFHAGTRPGQRWPTVYVGARPNATPVVNAMIAAGIKGGVNLAIAAPGITAQEANAIIQSEAGTPWPIVWVQYVFGGVYDTGLASKPWLDTVSVAPRKLVSVTLNFSSGVPETFRA